MRLHSQYTKSQPISPAHHFKLAETFPMMGLTSPLLSLQSKSVSLKNLFSWVNTSHRRIRQYLTKNTHYVSHLALFLSLVLRYDYTRRRHGGGSDWKVLPSGYWQTAGVWWHKQFKHFDKMEGMAVFVCFMCSICEHLSEFSGPQVYKIKHLTVASAIRNVWKNGLFWKAHLIWVIVRWIGLFPPWLFCNYKWYCCKVSDYVNV